MDFFYAGGYLFSEIVSVGEGEMCNGCFSFKGECRQPVFFAAVYIVLRALFEEFLFIVCELYACVVYDPGKNVLGVSESLSLIGLVCLVSGSGYRI